MNHRKTHFIARNEGFTCQNCDQKVSPLPKSYRNHCPFCLYSLHVDEELPGDRLNPCKGLMKPIKLEKSSRKGYLGISILHECVKCGKQIRNRLEEEDRWEKI